AYDSGMPQVAMSELEPYWLLESYGKYFHYDSRSREELPPWLLKDAPGVISAPSLKRAKDFMRNTPASMERSTCPGIVSAPVPMQTAGDV
ncbi:hypothetical protein, partial [Corynebacterium casei]